MAELDAIDRTKETMQAAVEIAARGGGRCSFDGVGLCRPAEPLPAETPLQSSGKLQSDLCKCNRVMMLPSIAMYF
jgi:hypothetical protein